MKDAGTPAWFEVDLTGFQTVQPYFFSKSQLPTLSISKSNFQFNLSAVESLQRCESIKMMVNYQLQQVLILPAHSQSKDSISWVNTEAKSNKPPKLECAFFAKQIYTAWDWNTEYRYKTAGRLVHNDRQVMLLFDFSECEVWDGYTQVRSIGSEVLEQAAKGKK